MNEAGQLPTVWRHIWTCADCAGVYAMSRQVLESTPSRDLYPAGSALPPVKAMPRHRPLVNLRRQYLGLVLPMASRHQKAFRGDDAGDVVVATQVEADLQFALSLRYVADGVWHITATVAPPPSGWLLLTLGEKRFRARFDAQGAALVSNVPDTLLAADDGPDLDVAIDEAI